MLFLDDLKASLPYAAWSPRHELAQRHLVLFCLQVVLGLKLEYLDAVGREQLTAAELLEFWAQAALLPDHDVLVRRDGCAAGFCICCLYILCKFTVLPGISQSHRPAAHAVGCMLMAAGPP